MPKIVITEHLDEKCAAWLAERAEVVWHRHDEPNFDAALAESEGLVVRTYTQVDDALLAKTPKLKVVGRAGVGLDNVDVPACRKRGVEVVYTPDANSQAVVEYVFGLMLDHYRPRTAITAATADQFHEMRKTEVGVQLSSLTLGILGMGRIGKRLARAAEALNIPAIGCDVLPAEDLRPHLPAGFELVDHQALYQRSDILTVHVDGRAGNRHLIGEAELSQLRSNVLLINAARGMLIDRPALRDWAGSHPESHSYLDVHDPEPIPPPGGETADPLWGLPNVTLLPHLASRTDDAMEAMSWVVRDVWSVLENRPPSHPAP